MAQNCRLFGGRFTSSYIFLRHIRLARMSERQEPSQHEEPFVKRLIVAAAAALGLTGCIAVPAPYGADAYYYPAPAVGIGVYSAPVYRDHYHHRHWRGHWR
jgi:hypothetical protein